MVRAAVDWLWSSYRATASPLKVRLLIGYQLRLAIGAERRLLITDVL